MVRVGLLSVIISSVMVASVPTLAGGRPGAVLAWWEGVRLDHVGSKEELCHLTGHLWRRIESPNAAATVSREQLADHGEEVRPTLYLDDRHRFAGHAVVAARWVEVGNKRHRMLDPTGS